jgi:UDP-glucose 4,6-dehydratase
MQMTTIFGHGYIGNAIADYLVSQGDTVYRAHHGNWGCVESRVIINAAGYTGTPNVDACELHREDCIRGNILWPVELERRFKFIPIIHISSGCIYDGYKEGGWTETDPPNFKGSFYSLTKALEQEELDLKNNYLLRIRMPFGKQEHPKNLLTKFRNYPKIVDGWNSLSCVEDIAKVVQFFVNNLPEPGIYNVCNTGDVLNREIIYHLGLTKEWFTKEEFDQSVKTPRSFCTLNNDKINKIFPMRSTSEALIDCIGG